MIGQRVIRMKRPAVLCAAAFVIGIALANVFGRSHAGWFDGEVSRSTGWMLLGIVGVWLAGCGFYLHRIKAGRSRISVADKLLFLIPVFFLLGFFVMKGKTEVYERQMQTFEESLRAGPGVLVKGTVFHIRWTKNGAQLELTDASVASYDAKETVYRPVGNVLLYADDLLTDNGEIKCGQKIFVYGNGSIFEGAPNPGGFDAKSYYFSGGITGAIHGKTIRITETSYHRLNQALFQAKNKLLNQYVTYLGEEAAGVISSMLLGERALLSEETKELYRHGGISHILAISGLHVSLIGMAVYNLLRKSLLGRNGAIPVACICVVLYGTFVEAGTSTKRAVIMFMLMLLATALGRTYDTLSAMSVSMIVILCGNPGALYTASFQLSFGAAYGASVMAAVLREKEKERSSEEKAIYMAKLAGSRWFRLREYVRKKWKSMFIFGLAIQAVTFPFTVYHFFEYPTYGFFLNPIVVPLMTILLLCGMLSGMCGAIMPWLGYFFAGGAKGILWIYDMLCGVTEKLPGALLLIGRPAVWQMALYFAILTIGVCNWQARGRKRIQREMRKESGWPGRLVQVRRKGWERISLWLEQQRVILLVLFFLPVCLLPFLSAKFEVSFLDAGQGDGIVMRERNGGVFLVDGGSSSVQKVGENRMIPYLKSQGIRVIDCAFVSHTDTDHISGLLELLTEMPVYSKYRESVFGYVGTPVVKRIVLPGVYGDEEGEKVFVGSAGDNGEGLGQVPQKWTEKDKTYASLVALAKEKNVEVTYMAAGDRMKAGEDLSMTCLAPEANVEYENKNAASMVLWVSYEEIDLLLTGDMEKEGEMRLLEHGVPGRRTVLSDSGSGGTADAYGGKAGDVSVEVLKVSHHGSYTASSEEFITAVKPLISVISCGKDNRYGHPHTETLETLYGANSRVYRTDESGCVTVKVGKRIVVEEFCK